MTTITYKGIELAIPERSRFYCARYKQEKWYFEEIGGFGEPVEELLVRGSWNTATQDMIHAAYFYWMRKSTEHDRYIRAICNGEDVPTRPINISIESDKARADAWAKLMEEDKS